MSPQYTWRRVRGIIIPAMILSIALGYLVIDGLRTRRGQLKQYELPADQSARSLLEFMRKLDGTVKFSNSFFETSNLKEVGQSIAQAHEQLKRNGGGLKENEQREADFYLLRYACASIQNGLTEGAEQTVDRLLSDIQAYLASASRVGTREHQTAFGAMIMLDSLGRFDAERQFAHWLQPWLAQHAEANTQAARELSKSIDGALQRLNLLGQQLELRSETLDGHAFDLEALRGKVVLVEFWGTRCVPCIEEFPLLKRIYATFHDRGFEIIGVGLNASPARLQEFLKEHQLPWPQLCDNQDEGEQCNDALMQRFGIQSVPSTFLIDREGRVVALGLRPLADEARDLETWLRKLLPAERAQP